MSAATASRLLSHHCQVTFGLIRFSAFKILVSALKVLSYFNLFWIMVFFSHQNERTQNS